MRMLNLSDIDQYPTDDAVCGALEEAAATTTQRYTSLVIGEDDDVVGNGNWHIGLRTAALVQTFVSRHPLTELRLHAQHGIDDGTFAALVVHLQPGTLRVLELCGPNVRLLTFGAVAEYLCKSSNNELTTLCLSSYKRELCSSTLLLRAATAAFVYQLAEGLQRCALLETLDLCGHWLGTEGGMLVAEALLQSGCPLQRLRLAQCDIGDAAATMLASIWATDSTVTPSRTPPPLRELDLSGNDLTHGDTALAFAEVLYTQCRHVERLSIAGNTKIQSTHAAMLVTQLWEPTCLRSLDLGNLELTRVDAQTIIDHLTEAAHRPPLVALGISQSAVDDDTLQKVAVLFPMLTSLSVAYCYHITQAAVDCFTGLRYLDIRNCKSITNVHSCSTALQTLYASGSCGITDAGLATANAIVKLEVNDNPNVTTVAPFAVTLREFRAMRESGICDAGLATVNAIVKLDVDYNPKVTIDFK